MCCYNMRFINEVLISLVDDTEKNEFDNELAKIRYEVLIEDIKSKLQENYFRLENCTFIAVSQAIYKYATRGWNQSKEDMQNLLTNRSTVNLEMLQLQQHILTQFVDGVPDIKALE